MGNRSTGTHIGQFSPYELVNTDDIKACEELDTSIGKKLGSATSAKYFEIDLQIVTPTIYRYEDDEEHQSHMPEVDDITPEAMEILIGVEIMIYHSDTVPQ